MKISRFLIIFGFISLNFIFTGNVFSSPSSTKADAPSAVMASKVSMVGNLKWTGWGIGKSHVGDLKIQDGFWEVKSGRPVSGGFTLDMNSIAYEKEKLVAHLKSEDFFSVAKYPTAKFVTTNIEEIKDAKANEPNYLVSGKLTVKDKTAPVSFKMNWQAKGDKVELAKASFEIADRTTFGITYNSKKFFDLVKLGDKLIEDRIGIAFELKPSESTTSL